MSYTIDIYNIKGEKVSTQKVDENVFNEELINHTAIADFVRLQMANERVARAHTKTRWNIQGSWRKLYRQKGTGSARVGDKKSPIRRKGGVVFGPSSKRNFSIRLPKKVRRKAMAGILSQKMMNNAVCWLDVFSYEDIKTKNAVATLKALSCYEDKTLLIVNGDNSIVYKSFNNLPSVKVLPAQYVNPRDMLNYTKVIFLADALQVVENNLSI